MCRRRSASWLLKLAQGNLSIQIILGSSEKKMQFYSENPRTRYISSSVACSCHGEWLWEWAGFRRIQ